MINLASTLSIGWPWYLTRASGIVAVGLLILLTVTGIASLTGLSFKFMEPVKAWANHRTLGISFLVATLVHVLSLLFDKFVSFSAFEIFVPFVSTYRRTHLLGLAVGSLGMALGILAFYLILAINTTSRQKIMAKRPRLWALTHYLSYLVLVMVFFHTIMIGTDFKNGFWRWAWYALNIVALLFLLSRIRRIGSLKK